MGILRTPILGPLVSGDEVQVKGLRGTYTFRAVVTSPHGDVHVELYGGSNGRRAFHAVTPDRVKIPGPRTLARQRRLRSEG